MPAGTRWRMCPSRCLRPPRPRTSASSSTSCWRPAAVGTGTGSGLGPALPWGVKFHLVPLFLTACPSCGHRLRLWLKPPAALCTGRVGLSFTLCSAWGCKRDGLGQAQPRKRAVSQKLHPGTHRPLSPSCSCLLFWLSGVRHTLNSSDRWWAVPREKLD